MSPTELPLRDVHVPGDVAWWPPAPGWWLLVLIPLVLAAGYAMWRHWRFRRSRQPRRCAHRALLRIRMAYAAHGDSRRLLRDLSGCLRRVALTVAPRSEVAALTGQDWLAFLDRHVPGQPFQAGAGRVLAEGPYRPAVDFDTEALLNLSEQVVESMTRQGAKRQPC